MYGRIGNHTVEYGALASWAADLLNVLTGNLDRPGGVMFDSGPSARIDDRAPGGRGFSIGRWHSAVTGRPEVLGEFPAATLADEIEGTPGNAGADGIKALFLLACNPVRSFPNSERLDAAFDGLDLLVAVDPYINASTRHAHVILPPTSALERSHYDVFFERNMIRSFARYSPPVFDVDRPGEPEILSRLALVLSGFGADADPSLVQGEMMRTLVAAEVDRADGPLAGRDAEEILAELGQWDWAEQVIDLRLRTGRFGDRFGADPDGLTLAKLRDDHPSGVDFGPLIERFPSAIRTPSGKVELFPEPIAADLERLAASPPGEADGLVLVGRRHLRSCNTWMHNVDVLVKGKERCTLQVHPDDAARLGVADGGRATVRSRVGEVTAPVEVTDEVMVGVVSLPFGWGHDTPGIEMRVARSAPGRQQQHPHRRHGHRRAQRQRRPQRHPRDGRARPDGPAGPRVQGLVPKSGTCACRCPAQVPDFDGMGRSDRGAPSRPDDAAPLLHASIGPSVDALGYRRRRWTLRSALDEAVALDEADAAVGDAGRVPVFPRAPTVRRSHTSPATAWG